jgi:NhaP-type Na+/H+ or K+/H+ antiporter
MYENLAVLALFAFAYSAVAGRLGRTPVSGPIVYLAFGVLAGPVGLGWLDLRIEGETIRLVAELTLALVLFGDAARADVFGVLVAQARLPHNDVLIAAA